jgi:hypothetical protein
VRRFFFCLSIFIANCILNPKSSAALNSVLSNAGSQFGFFYSSLESHARNETRADEPRREPGLEREIQQEERSRERVPQVRVQQSQRDRWKMRRELIQRHERKQNPSPPAVRRAKQQRMEQRRESSRVTRSSRPAQERRSADKSERQRDR